MSIHAIELQLSDVELERVRSLAAATSRTPAQVAEEALRRYVDLESWQLSDIAAGIAEADAGDFATEAEVKAVFARHGA